MIEHALKYKKDKIAEPSKTPEKPKSMETSRSTQNLKKEPETLARMGRSKSKACCVM